MEHEELLQDDATNHNSACLDSVWIIGDAIANPNKYRGDETIIERNVEHLEIMRNTDFLAAETLAAVDDAISAGKAALTE